MLPLIASLNTASDVRILGPPRRMVSTHSTTEKTMKTLPSDSFILDKHGREIKPGDVLKIWHFIGLRRKAHYMYKWVLREETLGKNKVPFLRVSHLTTGNVEDGYWLQKDGTKHDEYEIVQGYGNGIMAGNHDPFDERPKRNPLLH